MRKIVTLTLALVACCVRVGAQEEGFSKQIEVQKEYEVVIRSAERIETEVALLDTTIVRPELKYRIRPTAHITRFATSSLRPVEVSTASWELPRRLYLNVGGGVPLQSEADIYWAPVDNQRSRLEVRLNHEGVVGAKVSGDDGERRAALLLRNKAAVGYSALLGKRAALTANVLYRGTLGNSYGGVGVGEGKRPVVSVHDVEMNANLVGTFTDSLPLSYDANLMGLYAFNAMGESVWRFNVNYGLLGLNKLRSWLPGRVTLHYSGVESTCAEPYYDTSVTLVPEWGFRIGRWIPVEVMVGYDHMIYKGAKNSLNGVISSISTSFDRYHFAVPYLTVANDVQTKVTRDGLWENPYRAMLPVDSRKVFLAEAGVKGEVAKVSYKLSGATRWFSAYLFETIIEGSPLLGYGRSNAQRVWYADAELCWYPLRTLSMGVAAHFMTLGKAESATAEYKPRKWNLRGEVCWQPAERWSVKLRGEWKSSMGVTKVDLGGSKSLVRVPAYVDMGCEVAWRYRQNVNLWLRGDNLLNQPIYHWATYRAPGIGMRLGASMSF